MSVDSHVDPLDKMRARDVNKVARGEQAPRPAHEYGTVSAPPPPSAVDSRNNQTERENEDYSKEVDDEDGDKLEFKTAPNDVRFPKTNQTRHCYVRYLEYHRCIQVKGDDASECGKFQEYYRSLCPVEWIVRWNEQRANGTFPGPF